MKKRNPHGIVFRIKIKRWSATDYSFLVNNNLGWVSDCQQYYEFDDLRRQLMMYQQVEMII